jgi:hypothetical protein
MVTRLFVVHGMGEFDASWVKPIEKQLSDLYKSYPTLASVPQAQRFTIHPIRYDDVLSDLVKKWQTDATAISKLAAGVGASTAEAMVGWLKSAGTGFKWTHAADVLLYRCFSDVREAVLVTVANQLVKVINKDLNASQDCRWGVLAHSLGTSVAHDSLHALWTTQFPDGSAFDPADVKAAFVMMVANVSRLLETDVDVLESVVQPGTGSAKTRGCLNFLTVRHALDPFTVPRKFDPVGWPDAVTVEQERYKSIRVQHFRDRNIHGFGHYLQHPAVHIPLMRLLANKKSVISVAEETKALAEFTDLGSLPQGLVLAELKRLELMQPAQSDDWKAIRPIWDAFFGD